MGWMHYRIWLSFWGQYIDAGYGVEDTCWEPGCTAEIDRGLSYLCGQHPGGDEYGCGGYFCSEHLYYPLPDNTGEGDPEEESSTQRCGTCLDVLHGEAYRPRPIPEHVLTGSER